MTDADDLARHAREISARAERIADGAGDADALREELDRLDAELAQLDAEQRRLDDELVDRGEASSDEAGRRPGAPPWTDSVVDFVSDIADRVGAFASDWSWTSSEHVDRSVTVTGTPTVVIESRGGPIKVVPGAAGTVSLAAELVAPTRALRDEMDVTADYDGSTVLIRADWPEHRRGRRARLTVTVPSGTTVRSSTSGGSISSQDVHGPFSATTRGGAITIAGADGDVDARTKGGSVRVKDHRGSIHASTMGGSIHLAGTLQGPVEASTMGGSIHVEGASGATVVASTSGGSIDVRGRLSGDNRIRTAGGSVTVAIPPDSQAHIDGRGSSASSEFPDLSVTRGSIEGTLGDGSDGTIEFRTSGGSISLRKL